jgi:hypothetical protein
MQKKEKLGFYNEIMALYEAQRRKKGSMVISNDFIQ